MMDNEEISPCLSSSLDEKTSNIGVNRTDRLDGVENYQMTVELNGKFPSFSTDTLQQKFERLYGDCGTLPFDHLGLEDNVAHFYPPEERKAVERNYQLLSALRVFEESLVDIYGQVARDVVTDELRHRVIKEGITKELIEKSHDDCASLYRDKKAMILDKIEEVENTLRSENDRARQRSVTQELVPKAQSLDDEKYSWSRQRISSSDFPDDISYADFDDININENVSSPSDLAFVTEYRSSLSDAKKAFAKNWVVMQAAEFELKSLDADHQVARENIEIIDSRDTFVRLTIADSSLNAPDLSMTDESDLKLSRLLDEIEKAKEVERFYRHLRKRPKQEFSDVALVRDIVANIDILLREATRQKKDIEKQIRYTRGIKLKAKLMNRPLPRLIRNAVNKKSQAEPSKSNDHHDSVNHI